jgi:hypothetical protein
LDAEDEAVGGYVETALEALGELQANIEKKRRMLEERDFYEVYRLAGGITLLATQQERVDRRMYYLLEESVDIGD